LALLAALPVAAAAGERGGTRAREGAGARAHVLTGPAASCPSCVAAHAACTSGCFAVEDKAGFVKCMMGCDNFGGNCACDQQGTLRSEDILPRDSFAKDVCHGTVSCQPDYPSCASWTSYFDCGDPFCGVYRFCGENCETDICFGPALRQKTERYRVCFNALGQSCTEFQAGTNRLLGCGC
jgi:hypothetical protein